jgi:hypothetical protein
LELYSGIETSSSLFCALRPGLHLAKHFKTLFKHPLQGHQGTELSLVQADPAPLLLVQGLFRFYPFILQIWAAGPGRKNENKFPALPSATASELRQAAYLRPIHFKLTSARRCEVSSRNSEETLTVVVSGLSIPIPVQMILLCDKQRSLITCPGTMVTHSNQMAKTKQILLAPTPGFSDILCTHYLPIPSFLWMH